MIRGLQQSLAQFIARAKDWHFDFCVMYEVFELKVVLIGANEGVSVGATVSKRV